MNTDTNILTSLLICIFTIFTTCHGYYERLAAWNNCWNLADSSQSGIFFAPITGEMEGIKLVYRSDSSNPTCNNGGPVRWGCSTGISVFLVHITPGPYRRGAAYYPTSQTKGVTFGNDPSWNSTLAACNPQYYYMNGDTTGFGNYSEILLIDKANKRFVTHRFEQFAIQTSEALCTTSLHGNSGQQCADVYFLYSTPTSPPTQAPSQEPSQAPSDVPSDAPSQQLCWWWQYYYVYVLVLLSCLLL